MAYETITNAEKLQVNNKVFYDILEEIEKIPKEKIEKISKEEKSKIIKSKINEKISNYNITSDVKYNADEIDEKARKLSSCETDAEFFDKVEKGEELNFRDLYKVINFSVFNEGTSAKIVGIDKEGRIIYTKKTAKNHIQVKDLKKMELDKTGFPKTISIILIRRAEMLKKIININKSCEINEEILEIANNRKKIEQILNCEQYKQELIKTFLSELKKYLKNDDIENDDIKNIKDVLIILCREIPANREKLVKSPLIKEVGDVKKNIRYYKNPKTNKNKIFELDSINEQKEKVIDFNSEEKIKKIETKFKYCVLGAIAYIDEKCDEQNIDSNKKDKLLIEFLETVAYRDDNGNWIQKFDITDDKIKEAIETLEKDKLKDKPVFAALTYYNDSKESVVNFISKGELRPAYSCNEYNNEKYMIFMIPEIINGEIKPKYYVFNEEKELVTDIPFKITHNVIDCEKAIAFNKDDNKMQFIEKNKSQINIEDNNIVDTDDELSGLLRKCIPNKNNDLNEYRESVKKNPLFIEYVKTENDEEGIDDDKEYVEVGATDNKEAKQGRDFKKEKGVILVI